MAKVIIYHRVVSLGIRVFEPGGQGFESLRAHFLSKKFFGKPGPRGRKRADRTADGQQDRSTTRRRTGRAIQISLKAPNKRLDRQLRRASYIAIRQLSNVRAAPQVTTLKALLLPTPGVLPNSRFHHRWRETDSLVATQYARIDLVAIDICDEPEVSAT